MYYLCGENKNTERLQGYAATLICDFVFSYTMYDSYSAKRRFSHFEVGIIGIYIWLHYFLSFTVMRM